MNKLRPDLEPKGQDAPTGLIIVFYRKQRTGRSYGACYRGKQVIAWIIHQIVTQNTFPSENIQSAIEKSRGE
jgi:hypothetical protein